MTSATRQIAFINAAHTLCHYCLLILPTAVLAMATPDGAFGAEYGPILALATGMFVLYGALSLPQGWIAARIGRKRLISIYFLGTGASLVACGVAGGPWLLAATLAATGAFAAIYHPIGTAMLVEAAGDRPGRAIGTNGVFGNFGVALAPVVTAFLVGQYGWPSAFIVPGVLGVALGLLWLRVPAHDYATAATARPFPDIPRPIVRRAVVTLLLIAVVSGLVFNAFTLLIPKLLQERLAGDAGLLPMIGVAAFLVTLCGALTQFTVGRLIDRTTLRRVFLPMAVLLVPALGALAVLQGWAVLPVAGLAAAVIFGQVTVNETMTARYISPPLRARMYSVRFFVGFLGAAAAAPLIGVLHQQTGTLTAVLLVLAAAALVTVGCAWFFPDRQEELQPERWSAPAE
ncbi:MAG: MFS transporter [Gemmatimonadaceae bacterium]|nr:MFS transporter [Acetobacteraceae bacterium]